MAGPDRIVQEDFSAGMFRSVARERIPASGVYDIVNGLLDIDGAIYRRGGTVDASGAFGSTGFRMLWSGYLSTGFETVVANGFAFGSVDYGTGPPASITSHGGGGVTSRVRPVALDGKLYVPGRPVSTVFDGTSLSLPAKNADYYATVANRLIALNDDRIDFAVLTHQGTGDLTSGSASVATVKETSGEFQVGQIIVGTGIPVGATITAVGAGTLTLSANATATGTTVPLVATGGDPRFDPTDFHKLPGGVKITGGQGLRDSLMVFTNRGVWVVSNLSANLTDADGNVQQRLDLYNADLQLWGDTGLAAWAGGLIVPALDGVWFTTLGVASDSLAPFQLISGPIADLYRDYVTEGYTPGVATVFRGNYLLPILDGDDPIDLLVCRLDASNSRGQRTFPWSRLQGTGAEMAAFATSSATGSLLGAPAAGGKLARIDYFTPGALSTDYDDSAYAFEVVTRNFSSGALNENTVIKARAVFADLDAVPTLTMAFRDEAEAASELLSTMKPITDPLEPWVWQIGRRARYYRLGFSLVDSAVSEVSLKTLEVFVRPSARL